MDPMDTTAISRALGGIARWRAAGAFVVALLFLLHVDPAGAACPAQVPAMPTHSASDGDYDPCCLGAHAVVCAEPCAQVAVAHVPSFEPAKSVVAWHVVPSIALAFARSGLDASRIRPHYGNTGPPGFLRYVRLLI
ncbi:MAG: hypothetical protein ABIR52_11215 [Casimicrobiaceae bacterium]